MSTQQLPNGSQLLLRLAYSVQEKTGVTILVVMSCISLVAIVTLLSVITLSAFGTRTSLDEHLFVRTHVAAYFICLLLCDLLQAIGSIMTTRWINIMAIEAGSLCVTQGVLKQASDIGTAFWTLVIAIHTFCLLFLELKLRIFVLWTTLVGGWSAITALVLLGPAALHTEKKGPFFGISGYWCWISPSYKSERITLDYMIIFLAAFFSFVLYTLIFLRLRGNIVRNGWRVRFRRKSEAVSANWRGRKFADDQATAIAKQMLLYPLAYIVLVLPIASSRFASWAGRSVPFEILIFADAIFLLSGLVNVVLFSTTRRILPPQTVRFDRWSISRPRALPPTPATPGVDPYYPTAEVQPDLRARPASRSSSEGSPVRSSLTPYAEPKRTRKEKSRPPDIIIRRDSVESMYSVHEEEVQTVKFAQQRSSQWSPDGSPQRRSWQ